MTHHSHTRRRWTVVLTSGLLALGTLGVASADEHDVESSETVDGPVVVIDADQGILTIALPLDGEAPDCADAAPRDDAEPEASARERVTYVPGDCIAFTIEHPSGKTHHGAVVSTVAKQLHPSLIDGMTKGEIMREVAKVKLSTTDDEDNDGGPPEHAKDKSDKGNNGNGNGNGKAKGKDK